jgi:hypothetical protein
VVNDKHKTTPSICIKSPVFFKKKDLASMSSYRRKFYIVLFKCGRRDQSIKDENHRLRHKHSNMNNTCLSPLASSIGPLKQEKP